MLPQGTVETRSIFDALARSRGHPEAPPILYSGLQFGDYAFLGSAAGEEPAEKGGLGPGYRYVTWQVGRHVRSLAREGRIGFLPLRYRDIPRVFGRGGRLQVDVAVIQCTPPVDGKINLGIACSIFPSMVEAAKLVIAELHPEMPWTAGDTTIPADRIHIAVEATAPLGTLARQTADEVDLAIIRRVVDLIPDGASVQLGVGVIPETLLEVLAGRPNVHLHSGMVSDSVLDFLDGAAADTRVVLGEVAGSLTMYRRVAFDPRVTFRPTTLTHDLPYLTRLERFVSINSAIEVDLHGQVNSETLRGAQVSGVGGSLDFVEGARYSDGGISIIALRSTAKGRSTIVPRLETGSVVTIPRVAVDVVVSEHGVARLHGLDLRERAEALIGIAAPEARQSLRAELG